MLIEVPDAAGGGTEVSATEPLRPIDDALGGVCDADGEGLSALTN